MADTHTSAPVAVPSERDGWRLAGLAALVYVPLVLTARGQVAADTKSYLYLDPARMLSRAASMWDPHIGMGTVTHQNIGYLFPMGPYYWLLDRLGLPDWLAQRLWLASILFAAGAGMLFLLRTLRLSNPGRSVAALVYMLSPYSLHYAARISVILLCWAALPWLVGITVRAVRQGGWRHPALFALTVTTVGSVNATALVFTMVAPILWIPFAVWGLKETTWRRALAAGGRIAGLTVLLSLWWAAGLSLQSGYGLPILRYTETLKAVARTSIASEVLRGLGYWFFYGRDKLGPWIEPSVDYTQHVWLILVGFSITGLAFLFAGVVRWRPRAYFVALAVLGTVIAVGAYPFQHPSPLGAGFKAASASSVGLALRSTGRAVPLVVLGLSVLIGAGIGAVAAQAARYGRIASAVVGVLAVAGIPPLWTGHMIAVNLERPENIPAYWQEAASYLDGRGHDTRVLEIPGSDFASYRWGNTVDPITPGLMDRPYVARELIPYGSPPSADLLNALDRRLQEGVFEPESLAPLARLMSVGDLVVRSDLQFERYNLARPDPLWHQLSPPPPGLGAPAAFGPPVPNRPELFPLVDESALALPAGLPHPPPVAAFPVDAPRPMVRAEPAARPLVVAGDGEGLVDAATVGLLDTVAPVLYSASLDQAGLRRALDEGADLVLTDSNRRRARRWSTLRENTGYTEQAGEVPLVADPADARLDLFPSAPEAAYTVVEQRGVRRVQASRYGNPVSYTPEDRPSQALDGDPFTAWRVGAFDDPVGERLVVELDQPVTTDRLRLVQPVSGPRNRYITKATLHFDTGPDVKVDLGDGSREVGGQTVSIGTRTIRQVELVIDETNFGRQASYIGASAVGVAELHIGGARVDEVVRLPTDLLDRAGAASLEHPLTVLLSRLRSAQVPPRIDEELTLSRSFTLPAARDFALVGTARLSAPMADEGVDAFLDQRAVVASSSDRLRNDLRARASSAIDGDRATSWSTGLAPSPGVLVDYRLAAPVSFDHMDLQVVADGRHSVPTRLRVQGDDGPAQVVDLPAVADRDGDDATADVPVRLAAPVSGQRIRITVEAFREVKTLDYYSEYPIVLPVAVAEWGIPGVAQPRPSPTLAPTCRSDLLSVDGQRVPLRIQRDPALAQSRGPLPVVTCDGAPLRLGPGPHVIRSTASAETGIDVDRLVLSSASGGAAGKVDGERVAGGVTPTGSPNPAVRLIGQSSTSFDLDIRGATGPFWLVLGQSHNQGWTASLGGHSLGPPQLVDGYANGWWVDPGSGPSELRVSLRWTPQARVWIGLVVSGLGLLACILLVVVSRGRVSSQWGARLLPGRAAKGGSAHGAPRSAPPPKPPYPAPALAWPWAGLKPAPRWTVVAAAAVAAGLAGTVVVGPAMGLLAALAMVAGLVLARGVALVSAGAVGAVGLAGLATVYGQLRYRYPPEFEWPTFFPRAHWLGWAAVVLVAVGGGISALRRAEPDAGEPRPPGPRGFPGPSPPT